MRIIIFLFIAISTSAIANTKCSISGDTQSVSDRFAFLAFNPIYENGKLARYESKSVTEDERSEAVACLKKSIDMGSWRNAHTLSVYLKDGNKRLGIEKDEDLSRFYYGMFLGGKMREEMIAKKSAIRIKPENYEGFVTNLAVKNGCTKGETTIFNVEDKGPHYRTYEVSCDSRILAFKCEFDKPTPCYLK